MDVIIQNWSCLTVKVFFSVDISNQSTIRVITKLPNTEQSSKGKVKTHKSINRQNQSTTGKLGNMAEQMSRHDIYSSESNFTSYFYR